MLWIINCISSTSHISIVLRLGADHKSFSRLRHLFLVEDFTFITGICELRHLSQQKPHTTVLTLQISKYIGSSEVSQNKPKKMNEMKLQWLQESDVKIKIRLVLSRRLENHKKNQPMWKSCLYEPEKKMLLILFSDALHHLTVNNFLC